MIKARKNTVVFVKTLACISSVMAVVLLYNYTGMIHIFSKLTHPSAFLVVAICITVVPSIVLFPMALIPVKQKDKLFKSPKYAEKFIETIFSVQIIGALCINFFSLRFDYFDLYLSFRSLYDWAYLFFMMFLISVYMHEKLLIGTKFLYFSGVMQIVFTIASFIFDDFGLDIVTGFALITIVISYMVYELAFENIKTGFYYDHSGKSIENDELLESYKILNYNDFEKRG